MIQKLTILKLTLPNRFPFGEKMAGFTKMILEVGFSGIAVITWAGERLTTRGRSKDGWPSKGI